MSGALFFTILVVIGLAVLIPYSIFSVRRRYLRALATSTTALEAMTKDLLADQSARTIDEKRGITSVEGTFKGEPIRVSVSFPPEISARYVQTGYKSSISMQTRLTVGLLGATPRFVLEAKPSKLGEIATYLDIHGFGPKELLRAWDVVDIDPDLDVMNDELRREVIELASQGVVRSIRISTDGLSISWVGENDQLASMAGFALKLRARILDSIERRARSGVRIDADAYREASVRVADDDDANANANAADEAIEDDASGSSRRTL